MTTYRSIAATETDPDAPITSSLAKAWAGNVEAIIEGDPSAPRLRVGALERLWAGNQVRSRRDAVQTTNSTTFVQPVLFPFIQAGWVRITLEHRVVSGGFSSEVEILRYRNLGATQVAFWSTTSAGFVFRSADISVLPGDSLIVQHRVFASTTTSAMQNVRLQTNGESYLPGVEFPVEGNVFL